MPLDCFCGRMPPKKGPLWRGERAEEKPEGARARCARVRCAHMDVRSANPVARSRTWRAGCPEGALLGVCFFRLPFFAQAKKGDSLARRASESFALQKGIKMDSRLRGNDGGEGRRWIIRDSCRVPFGPFATRMFATASCLRSPACAGMTSKRKCGHHPHPTLPLKGRANCAR